MNKQFRLLDCTLRDGGHITNGVFGEENIKGTVESLVEAGVDIIEVGFMWNKQQSIDNTRYYLMDDVRKILPNNLGNSKISVMIEKQDLIDNIEQYNGTIEYIRIIFKRHLIEWACSTALELKKKGYKVFMNPVNCTVYSDEEYIALIERVNIVKPYAFSMVDTFGNMRMESFIRRFVLLNEHLDHDIIMGIHLHENLGMAFAMAQRAIETRYLNRQYIIDASLMGMGRDPGNLKIEQISEYMNYCLKTNYALAPIYNAIDRYILPIYRMHEWGFKLPYAMSAYYDLHRTYPEYLMTKTDISLKDIDIILSHVNRNEAEYYNEAYIESLYQEYEKKQEANTVINEAYRVFNKEISALMKTRNCLDSVFSEILNEIVNCSGKVIITGMGKSGHIGVKIAATLSSLGTPSFFLHPAEAMHGDLGMVTSDDIVIAISYSGESDEIIKILPTIKVLGAKLIGITGNSKSTLAEASDIVQVLPKFAEACYLGLAPTSSTTAVLCYGDALAVVASGIYGFEDADFGKFHPAGSLGKKLVYRVSDLMDAKDQNATISIEASLKEAIMELSRKGLGIVSIIDKKGALNGVITEGNLRRMLENEENIYSLSASEVMTKNPYTIDENRLAYEALIIMKERKISCLPVLKNGIVVGTIRLQAIIGIGII